MAKKQKEIILDKYEKEILDAYENGELKPTKSKTDYQASARNTMKKNRKINIRISENDLSAIQRRAAREGIPYPSPIYLRLTNMAFFYYKNLLYTELPSFKDFTSIKEVNRMRKHLKMCMPDS